MLKINIQLFGGRGGSSPLSSKNYATSKSKKEYTDSDNAIEKSESKTFKTGYAVGDESVDKVYNITTNGNGSLTISRNFGKRVGGSNKYPTTEFTVKNAYIITKHNGAPTISGINWDNVKSFGGKYISANTPLFSSLAKQHGFAYDPRVGRFRKLKKR